MAFVEDLKVEETDGMNGDQLYQVRTTDLIYVNLILLKFTRMNYFTNYGFYSASVFSENFGDVFISPVCTIRRHGLQYSLDAKK